MQEEEVEESEKSCELESDSAEGNQTRRFFEDYRKENKVSAQRAMSYVKHLLGDSNKPIVLNSIKDTAKQI